MPDKTKYANETIEDDDELVFEAEDTGQDDNDEDHNDVDPWLIMIVDDEEEVHRITKLTLRKFRFDNKPLKFISAYTGEEALKLLQDAPDVALIFLDVVMETDDAGLRLARTIREELDNRWVRIILRTGQPGEAPEEKVIVEYDINDYRTKIELTRERMLTALITALRAYRDIITIETQREKVQNLLNASNRFVPFEFLNLLNKNNITELHFGDCVETEMTVLFADLRSFTSLSEAMNPEEIFSFLNSYLSDMEPIIQEHHGFVDKFIGDAIMALFGGAADDALQAAIAMLQQLLKYNQGRAKVGHPPIQIGIGINTGTLMLGTVGSQNRMEGTVISDAANLTSRLEGLTKIYGASLLISEHTLYKLKDPGQYATRFIDRVRVKGKNNAVAVYEVFDADAPDIREKKLANVKTFEKAWQAYQKQMFHEAGALFQECLDRHPEDQAVQVYLKRCQHFMESTPAENWDTFHPIMQWSPNLSIGVHAIDQQHQELFRRINDFIKAIEMNKAKQEVISILQLLEEYIMVHFEAEEALMTQHGYPDADVHKAKHIQFTEGFHQLKAEHKTRGNSLHLALRIQSQLLDWWNNHIVRVDKKLGIYLKY